MVPLSLPSDKSSTVVGPEVSQIEGLPTYTTDPRTTDPRPCCAVPSSTPVGPGRNETFLCTGTVTHQQNKMFVQRMDQEVPHHFFLTPIKVSIPSSVNFVYNTVITLGCNDFMNICEYQFSWIYQNL